jgi:hypothetical protein
MSSDGLVVLAYFSDGYSLRNALAFLRQTCTRANFIFTPKGITIKEADATDTILVHYEFYAEELTDYRYNAFDESGNLIPAIACGFQTLEMQKNTKMVGKRDAVMLYTKNEESQNIYIQVVHSGSKSGDNMGLRIVPILDVELDEFEDITYNNLLPNTKTPSSEFAKMCADFSSLKCTYTDVIGFPEGIRFEGIESGTVRAIETFGTINEGNNTETNRHNYIDLLGNNKYSLGSISVPHGPHPKLSVKMTGETCRIRINSKTIRAMAKFNNLSPSGVIKFHLEENKPFKISSNIGCYGKLTLYIKDVGMNE